MPGASPQNPAVWRRRDPGGAETLTRVAQFVASGRPEIPDPVDIPSFRGIRAPISGGSIMPFVDPDIRAQFQTLTEKLELLRGHL